MSHVRSTCARLLCALIPAASGCDATGAASSRAPILNGELSPDDVSVGALVEEGGHAFCTGTMIGPELVLTAAHCVVRQGRPLRLAASVDFGVSVGEGPACAVDWIEVFPDYDAWTFEYDAALLKVRECDVAPVPLAQGLEPGEVVRFVGYGLTETGDSHGERRTVALPILDVDASSFGYGEATCNGDSGGPALRPGDTGSDELVGITSHGPRDCRYYGRSSRADVLRDWIRQRRSAATASVDADGRCVVAAADLDPDCHCPEGRGCSRCTPDSGLACATAAEGEACGEARACAAGTMCVAGACRQLCQDGASSASCREGACIRVDEEGSACVPDFGGCSGSPEPPALPGALLILVVVARWRTRLRRQPRPRHCLEEEP